MEIRPEQMAALDKTSQESFEARLIRHIRTKYASVAIGTTAGNIAVSELSGDCLAGMVHHGISRALAYGLTWESSIAAYVALLFAAGPRFDEHSQIHKELLDDEVPVNSKVENLCYVIAEPVWKEARTRQSPLAWAEVCPALAFAREENKSV